jgi:hypothetical protein
MPHAFRRKPSLFDAVVFVVAMATGFWVNRNTLYRLPTFAQFANLGLGLKYCFGIDGGLWVALPHLASWTLAALAIQLRAAWPRLREVAQQPGMAAIASASVSVMVISFVFLASSLKFSVTLQSLRYSPEAEVFHELLPQVGIAVAGSWLTLVLGAHWKPEPHWIDRLCRGIGVCWIGATLLYWSRYIVGNQF